MTESPDRRRAVVRRPAYGGLLVLIAAVLLAPGVQAQDIGRDSRVVEAVNLLDRWVEAKQAYEQFPGLSLAVVHDQTVLLSRGYGYADTEARRPATPETVYSICSVSKLFTSVAAMRLVDRGALDLDEPISRVLPWFTLEGNPVGAERVTARTLITHTAGFGSDIGAPPDSAPHLYNVTREDFRALLPGIDLRHPPGTRYAYSNVGMVLLGEVVAAAASTPFAEFVSDSILGPLGMSSTTPDVGEVFDSGEIAVGYGPSRDAGGWARVGPFQGNAMIPARGFASTVQDLARFSSWQFRLLNGSEEILKPGTLREMVRSQVTDSIAGTSSGFGFAIYDREEPRRVGHAGTCPGFRADLLIEPEGRLAVVALSNSMIPVWEFTVQAHRLVAPAVAAALSDPAGARPLPEDLEPYVGTYEAFPWAGEWQVIPWNGGLATIYFPLDDPLSRLRPLESLGGGEFRVVRDDGTDGMSVSFESDETGRIVRMVTDGFYPRRRIG